MPFGDHTLLLTPEGGLVAFGWNSKGQLGLGHQNNQTEPTPVPWEGPRPVQVDWGCEHSLVLDEEGGVWEAGLSRGATPFLTFQRVPSLPPAALVCAGWSHSAVLDTNGALWVWNISLTAGSSSSDIQRVDKLPPLLKVACGNGFLVAEAREGLWVFGTNSQGQLGLGHTKDVPHMTPLQVVDRLQGPLRCLEALYNAILIIDSQGAVWTAGDPSDGQLGRVGDHSVLQRISGIPPMRAASCGLYHTLALDEEGGVWVWGCNGQGRLGTGDTLNQSQPIRVSSLKGTSALLAGRAHSLAFQPDGGLSSFGYNCYGQLGLRHTTSPILVPTRTLLRAAGPRSGVLVEGIEKKAIWDTLKAACESQESLGDARPLPTMSQEELQRHQEAFRAGLYRGTTPAADWNGLHTKARLQREALEQEEDAQATQLAQGEAKRVRLVKDLEGARAHVTQLETELRLLLGALQSTKEVQEAINKRLCSVRSFEPLLKAAAETESETRSSMRRKLTPFRASELTGHDLGFALSHFGVDNVPEIAQTLEKEISMDLLGDVTDYSLASLGVEDVMQRQRILLSLHTLTNGLMLDEGHVEACGVCQNQTPEESVAFLEECGINLPKQRVLELRALVGHLMLMDPATIHQTFKVSHSAALQISKRLKQAKKDHLRVTASV